MKRFILPLCVFLLCCATFLSSHPQSQKEDLWIVHAVIGAESTTTTERYYENTTKIEPDRLVRGSSVTTKKEFYSRDYEKGNATVIAIMKNEGSLKEPVLTQAVSTTVFGNGSKHSELRKLNTVNDYPGLGDEYRTIRASIAYHTGSVTLEYCEDYQSASAWAEGKGTSTTRQRIFKKPRDKKGDWVEESSTTEVSYGTGGGAQSGDSRSRISRSGNAITFDYYEPVSERKTHSDGTKVTTTGYKRAFITARPYSAPELRIIRVSPEGEEDITGSDVKVAAGERMELFVKPIPEKTALGEGRWRLEGGGENPNYIRKFEANKDYGRVIPIPEADLKKNAIVFYWTGGDSGRVFHTAEANGNTLSASAKFTIQKPDVEVTVTAKEGSTFKKLDKGAFLNPSECYVTSAYSNEEMYGCQYDGITFEAEQKDDAGLKGKLQWVQLIRMERSRQKYDDGGCADFLIKDALDICYPHQKGPRAYDAPAVVAPSEKDRVAKTKDATTGEEVTSALVFLSKKQESRNYLMFMPEKPDSEWVPLYYTDWAWSGAVQYYEGRGWEKESQENPGNPQAEPTEQYPEWEKNSGRHPYRQIDCE